MLAILTRSCCRTAFLVLAGQLAAQETPAPPGQQPGAKPPADRAAERRGGERAAEPPAPLLDPRETHFAEVRQLTFEGENAEGYFDPTGKKLVFQARKGKTGLDCDQIFEMDLETGKTRLVSTGKGRTTCAYYHEGGKRILYASTHLAGPECPKEPDMSRGYVWPVFKSYDIFSVAADDASDLVRLTETPGYDAEAVVCPATGRILFTSARDGDLELYSMKDDGSDVKRLTSRLGYDGGGFFSADGTQIVWRAMYPEGEAAEKDFQVLLADGLVRPTKLEIWVAKSDGSQPRQVTKHGKASFAPYFFPDGKRIVYAANLDGPREFHLYAVDADGKNQERLTWSSRFNSFPMFSPDGKHLVFASNRCQKAPGDTNLFLATWRE